MVNSTMPKLDKPGAGLPFYEWAVANYIIVPIRMMTTSESTALNEFQSETTQIETMVSALSEAQLSERRLIARLNGLEDSSRYWSVAMTLKHLIIVNTRGMGLVRSLSSGIIPNGKASTADVKPEEDIDTSTIVSAFVNSSQLYIENVSSLNLTANPSVTFNHPWFGKWNAKQWVLFAAPHMKIHRGQIAAIIERL